MDQTDHQSHTQSAYEADRETDAKWLTFKELAAARRISKASAQSLIRRHGWRRQTDNQGRVRALVPLVWVMPQSDSETGAQTADPTDDQTAGQSHASLLEGALAALETAVMSLTARAEAAEQGRDDERARAEDLRVQIAVLNAEIQVAGADADRALAAARAEAQEALQALDELRAAEAERKARGPLARAWTALRGR